MDAILKHIKDTFHGVEIKQKRPGVFQLYLPLYHEDGDMVDMFIAKTPDGSYQICDYGLTLQRLAYSYDIDTDNKEAILDKILIQNSLINNNGNICLATSIETVFSDILHASQVYAKVGSMEYFKREVIESLFYEALDDFIMTNLKEFHPAKKIMPLPDKPYLEVDYKFTPNGHDVFLFAVKDSTKAKMTTISILEFQKQDINFRGWVVNEDFDKLSKKDRKLLTDTCDKQFTSFDAFQSDVVKYLEREKK